MSDTLQQEHERRGGEYRCSRCRRDLKTMAAFGEHKCESGYCDECKGVEHAPWCSLYKSSKEVDDREHLLQTLVGIGLLAHAAQQKCAKGDQIASEVFRHIEQVAVEALQNRST